MCTDAERATDFELSPLLGYEATDSAIELTWNLHLLSIFPGGLIPDPAPFIFLFLGTAKSSPNSFVYFICWMPLPVSFFSWQVTNSMNSFLSLKDTRIHGNVWCIVFSIVIIKWMLFAKNCFVFYSVIVRIEFGIWMVICVRTQY